MSYVTSVERNGIRKGREQGWELGRQQGAREGLLMGIDAALELKFGNAGCCLLPEIEALADAPSMERVLAAIRTAQKLDDVRAAMA